MEARKAMLISSCLGVYLEFLDYGLCAAAALVFSYYFFPESEPFLAHISGLSVIALSFLARPFGAILFGHLGDRLGGKKTLLISSAGMSVATVMIGCLPTYNSWGIYASIILILLRIIQGICVSPECGTVSSYLKLTNQNSNFYLITSIIFAVGTSGFMSGSIIMGAMLQGYSIETMPDLRWRLPFILSGILVGGIGILLRIFMDNPGKPDRQVKLPFISLLRTQRKILLQCLAVAGFVSFACHTIFSFIAHYLQAFMGYNTSSALSMSGKTITSCLVVSSLLSGFMADKFSPLRVMSFAAKGLICVAPLSFLLFSTRNEWLVITGISLLTLFTGLFSGILPGFLADMFHDQQRYTGANLSHNLGAAVFGGISPLLMMFLAKKHVMLPSLGFSLFALIMVFLLKSVSGEKNIKTKLSDAEESIDDTTLFEKVNVTG